MRFENIGNKNTNRGRISGYPEPKGLVAGTYLDDPFEHKAQDIEIPEGPGVKRCASPLFSATSTCFSTAGALRSLGCGGAFYSHRAVNT